MREAWIRPPAPIEGREYSYEVRQQQIVLPLAHDDDPTAGHLLMPICMELLAQDETDMESDPVVVAQLDFYRLAGDDHWAIEDYVVALDSIDSDTAEFMDVVLEGECAPFPEAISEQFSMINHEGPVALLQTLFVDEAWRGRGLGLALLAHTLKYHMRGYSYAVMRAWPLQYGPQRPEVEAAVPKWLGEFGYSKLPGSEQKARTRLEKLYGGLGFEKLKQPAGAGWMGLSFSYVHKGWDKALAAAR